MPIRPRTRLRAAPPFARAIALAVGCLAVQACTRPPDLRDGEGRAVTELVLPAERCGDHFVADVEIGGAGTFRMLLDTGTPRTLLDDRALARLGPVDELDDVRIGGFRVRGPLVYRRADLDAVGRGIGVRLDGILGYHAFRDVAQSWDWSAGEVRVSSERLPRAGPGVVGMARHDRPIVRMDVAGRRTPVMIDTGLSGAFSFAELDRLPLEDDPVVVEMRVRVDGTGPVRMARLSGDVAFGDIVVPRPLVRDAVEGSLMGIAAMRAWVVELDPRVGRARFRAPDGSPVRPVPPDGFATLGLLGALRSDGFAVSGVLPESGAARAGLVPGDRIVAIDGAPLPARNCAEAFALSSAVDPVELTVERMSGGVRRIRVVPTVVVP